MTEQIRTEVIQQRTDLDISTNLYVQGMEILSFDRVELTKNEMGTNSFIELGTLRVIYFQEFDRFMLDLGDWEYILLKRFPVTSTSRTDMETRTYTFPTYNGVYALKINRIVSPEALQNFETILSFTTKFSYLGEDIPVRQNELSPDVSLIESPEQTESVISSTKSSFSRKSAEEDDPLKLHGKERIKRSFAKFVDHLSGSHAKKTIEKNVFMTRVMNFEDMKKPNVEFAPISHFGRREVRILIY